MHSSYRNISDNIGPPTLAQALYLSAGAADKTHIIVRRAQHPDYWEKSDKMGVKYQHRGERSPSDILGDSLCLL